MQIGNYTLHTLELGSFGLDGGAMFGIVPKPLWSKSDEADDANRIELALRCLLVRVDGRTIVVDTGIGSKWAAADVERYAIDQRDNRDNCRQSPATQTTSSVTHDRPPSSCKPHENVAGRHE